MRAAALLAVAATLATAARAVVVPESTPRPRPPPRPRAGPTNISYVHLIFSNHLDIGFGWTGPGPLATDINVINRYFDDFFPAALETARVLRERGGPETYSYMTHAWLVSLYLDCPPDMGLHCPPAAAQDAFRAAAAAGDVYWHALPHNAQVELFNGPTLLAAVDVAHALDKAFGMAPKLTASQRDVPGLTRAALPLLVVAGVRALSLGLNTGAPPAAWPLNAPFFWVDRPSGARALTMVHPGGYSGTPVDAKHECITAPGFEHALCCAWRNDNAGPHSPDEVLEVYARVAAYWPDAHVSDSNFDAFTARLLEAADSGAVPLPEFDQEVGDVWVYGAASDAAKLAEARALMRARALMDKKNGEVAAFSRQLVKLVEHTWSSDIKESLNDTKNWANPAFAARLAAKDPRYEATVSTWELQAAYAARAKAALRDTPSARVAADELNAVTDAYAGPPDPVRDLGLTRVNLAASNLSFGRGAADGWWLDVDRATGALAGAASPPAAGAPRTQWARGPADPLAAFVYSTYTESDFSAFIKDYLYIPLTAKDAWWVTADLGKAGLAASGAAARADFKPSLIDVWTGPAVKPKNGSAGTGLRVVTRAALPAAAVAAAGAPAEVWLDARAPKAGPGAKLFVDVWWVNKTATRLPEAAWVRFAPARAAVNASGWALYKLHSPVSPLEVARNGSHGMHGVTHEGVGVPSADGRVELAIGSLDAALVSPGAATPFPRLTGPAPAELADHGVSFNLANNAWGTNYPQWQPYGARAAARTMRFRFRVGVDAPSARRAPGASPAAQAVKQALAAQAGSLGAYYKAAGLGARSPGGGAGAADRAAPRVAAQAVTDAPAPSTAGAGEPVAVTDVAAGPWTAADAAAGPWTAATGGFAAPRAPPVPGFLSFAQKARTDDEPPLGPVVRVGGRAP